MGTLQKALAPRPGILDMLHKLNGKLQKFIRGSELRSPSSSPAVSP